MDYLADKGGQSEACITHTCQTLAPWQAACILQIICWMLTLFSSC